MYVPSKYRGPVQSLPRSRWQRLRRRWEPESDAYSDLLFVFSWTATAHWLTVVGSFAVLIAAGFDRHLIPPHANACPHIAAGLLAFIAAYAVSLFLVTLLTLAQVGNVYIKRLRMRGQDKNETGESGTTS